MKRSMESWKDYTLGEVADFINGRAFKTAEWEDNGRLIIRIQDLTGKIEDPHFTTKTFEPKYLVRKGDLLISWSATLDAFIWKGDDAWLNQHIFKVEEKPQLISKKFLYYFVKKEIDLIKQHIHGSTMKHITKKTFLTIKIRLPSVQVQNEIVGMLEKAEQLKQWRKEADKLSEDYINSVFLDMFGDPIKNERNWTIKNLGDCCKGKPEYGSGSSSVDFNPSLPRYIRITDVDEYGNLKENSKVSPSMVEEKYLLHEGDVLFARSGATVGKTYLHKKKNDPALFAGYMIRFKPNKEILNPFYLFYFTKTEYYQGWIRSKKKVVAQPNINAKQYSRELKIPIPYIRLQNRFAEIVEQVQKIREYQRKSKSHIYDLLNVLSEKAFAGELKC